MTFPWNNLKTLHSSVLNVKCFLVSIINYLSLSIVLRAIEIASMKTHGDEELAQSIRPLDSMVTNKFTGKNVIEETRRLDQASHFILRLAFCQTAENIRWFVTQETILFRIRFHLASMDEKEAFVNQNTLIKLSYINEIEKNRILPLLKQCSPGREHESFVKINFELVPDLVARKAIFLKKGDAFVPKSHSFSILLTVFQENLEFWMARTAREIPKLNVSDDRLIPILNQLKTHDPRRKQNDYSGMLLDGGKVSPDTIDQVPISLFFLYFTLKFYIG